MQAFAQPVSTPLPYHRHSLRVGVIVNRRPDVVQKTKRLGGSNTTV